MSNVSISYFYDILGLPTGSLKVYYDWGATGLKSGISSGIVVSQPYADSIYSGLFTGGSVQIKNETGLFSNKWSMFFNFSKTGSGNGVLFSDYHSGASGFVIGINDTNHLFFETNESNFPTIFLGGRTLNAKNLLCVSNYYNYIQFDYYDAVNSGVVSEGFYLGNKLNDSTGWYLSKAVNPPSGFNINPYNEELYSFTYITEKLSPMDLDYLFKGFYTETGVINSGYVSGLKVNGFNLNTGSLIVERASSLIYNNSQLFWI
jgi:hypothetical protein